MTKTHPSCPSIYSRPPSCPLNTSWCLSCQPTSSRRLIHPSRSRTRLRTSPGASIPLRRPSRPSRWGTRPRTSPGASISSRRPSRPSRSRTRLRSSPGVLISCGRGCGRGVVELEGVVAEDSVEIEPVAECAVGRACKRFRW